ncbi:hypothetical protein SKP52_02515 [Sphingopyxis fribergensis]|uniref:Uncharacterized protein n=1 Tax=Sphingopyxis fribergensis TaxID=1515612 RepID=A0A0A7PDX7_9SPHN|nr:hypothetical protein [Sphingopyxis fribergensis]AJA07438.1 hypothetical protein SKP52_02515 [Sphingopyxis fribergensis]
MSGDERALWLSAAWAEVRDIPARPFVDACTTARRIVEHPAKLVPTIVRESQEVADIFRRRLAREEAAWANRSAPRLARPDDRRRPDESAEVGSMMSELIEKLKGQADDLP